MKCNIEAEQIFDVGSLYMNFGKLRDKRKPKGLRYRLETILVIMTLAKLCGEDHPSGMAEWAKHRTEFLIHVREDILEEEDGPVLQHGLKGLHQSKLILPNSKGHYPSRDALAWRYGRFTRVS